MRGWYDGRSFVISREGAHAGDGCIAYHWKPNTTTPEGSSGLRRLFEPTDTVYVRFFIRLSKDWGWTGRPYHPHLMHFLTTENGKYHGPAASHLTVYIEPQEGRLRLAAQDIQNRDTRHGLTQGPLRGGYNGTFYDSKDVLFTDDAWHCVEAMFRLNSLDLERDRPNADGVVRAWFDGKLVVERTDVILRSTDFPDMKFNQFLLAPYFGPGLLPHEQTLWIDELVVGTERLGAAPARAPSPDGKTSMRVAAAQPRDRTIDFRLKPPEVLARVDQSLAELEQLVRKAGDAGCDALALPEDTLGLLKWEAANPGSLDAVLPEAVTRMLDRLGKAAADHRMYLVVCNDALEEDGRAYNTAFLLGRDGKEIGRYHKVNLPLTEQGRSARPGVPGLPHAGPGDGRHADLLRHGLPRGGAVPGAGRGRPRVPSHARRRGLRRRRHQPGRVPHAGRGELHLPRRRDARPRQHDHLAAGQGPRHRGRARWAGHRRHRPVRRARGRGRLQHPGATCAAGCSASGSPRPTASSPIPNRPCSPRCRRT